MAQRSTDPQLVVLPSELGEESLEGAVRQAARALGLRLGGAMYGCGLMGCAAPLLDGRRVLKVTSDLYEVDAVRAAIRDGRYDGFVRVFVEPVRLWSGSKSGVYAYTREAITPVAVDPKGQAAAALFLWKRAAERHDVRSYLELLPLIARDYPGVAAFAGRILDQGTHLLGDAHRRNLGAREDGAVVLFDAELFPLDDHERLPS